ncbi:serum response factor-binding protein 1 isoform X2 [Prorops nasuta]|uniref:serum response factor-binding protein 1 isoform X2 n=1 Tax=Prorops nasuta TaxID=863751 RepID=UPI0034CDAABA
MGKIEINNEIVLMRHNVRKARVCVINKLSREAKKLRSKHGDDKQKEKYNKKADKFIQEIMALKKVKDDDISKFGIINSKELKELLEDHSLDPKIHILARVVNEKNMSKRISQFKEKFPDYKDFVNLENKKSMKRKNDFDKSNVVSKSASKIQSDGTNDIYKNNSILDTHPKDDIENKHTEGKQSSTQCNAKKETIKNRKINDTDCEEIMNTNESYTNFTDEEQRFSKMKEKKKYCQLALVEKDTSNLPKIISKEATVRRLTEIVKEQDSENGEFTNFNDKQEVDQCLPKFEKEVDDFFTTGDGRSKYLSVVVPKSNDNENEFSDNSSKSIGSVPKRKHLGIMNDRSFNKTDKFNRRRERGSEKHVRMDWCKQSLSRNLPTNVLKDPIEKQGKTNIHSKRINMSQKVNNYKQNDCITNLHPSWAAKKKQQELIKEGFKGKKIVFDDD